MAPVLEELALLIGERIESAGRIRAEARKRRHVVRARQNVDGVDLEGMDARHELAQVRDGRLGGPWTESLRCDGKAARFGQREAQHPSSLKALAHPGGRADRAAEAVEVHAHDVA